VRPKPIPRARSFYPVDEIEEYSPLPYGGGADNSPGAGLLLYLVDGKNCSHQHAFAPDLESRQIADSSSARHPLQASTSCPGVKC
jgi:hypothetical protein